MSFVAHTETSPFAFIVRFQIAGATEPDEYAKLVYDSDELQDMALMGPDEYGCFDGEFDREAPTFPTAVMSALRDLEHVLPEAEIKRVENDNLVTLAAIARRVGCSHESVRLYARSRRGPGGFPSPVGKIDNKTEVWEWADVAEWWETTQGRTFGDAAQDAFVSMINDALDMRRATARLGDDEREAVHAVARLIPAAVRAAVGSA